MSEEPAENRSVSNILEIASIHPMELRARVSTTHSNCYKQELQGVKSLEIYSLPILKCEKEERTTHMYCAVNNIIMRESKLNDKELCLSQMSVAKGIRAFGDSAIQTVLNESSQSDNE